MGFFLSSMLTHKIYLALLIALSLVPSHVFAGCNAPSAGTYQCYIGLDDCCNPLTNWTRYDDSGWLYYHNFCNRFLCSCGDADQAGPCAGCGYQSKQLAGNCYANTACNSACVQAPEVPPATTGALYASAFLLAVGFARRGNKRRVNQSKLAIV